MATPEELNEQLKATAAAYNSKNPTGRTEDDAAAVAAAHALNQATGSQTHAGTTEVRADTPEEAAAAAKKKEEAAAAEKEKAEAEAKAKAEAETPEQKEAREKAEKEAAAKAEADKAEKEETAEWITTDSKELNAAIGLMKKSGVTAAEADAIFGDAVNAGDIAKVDEKTLVEKVGEDAAALIMSGLTSYVEVEGQAALAKVRAVQDAVGGKEAWTKMTAWAREKAAGDEAFKAEILEINALMNGNSQFQAKLAAQAFKNMYEGDPKNSSLTPSDPVKLTGTATAAPASSTEALSARAYAEKVQDANRTLRGGELQSKLRELSAGRQLGRKKGI